MFDWIYQVCRRCLKQTRWSDIYPSLKPNSILKWIFNNVKINMDTRPDFKPTWNNWLEIDPRTRMNTFRYIVWTACLCLYLRGKTFVLQTLPPLEEVSKDKQKEKPWFHLCCCLSLCSKFVLTMNNANKDLFLSNKLVLKSKLRIVGMKALTWNWYLCLNLWWLAADVGYFTCSAMKYDSFFCALSLRSMIRFPIYHWVRILYIT